MANFDFTFGRQFNDAIQARAQRRMQFKFQNSADDFRKQELGYRATELSMRQKESDFNMRIQEENSMRQREQEERNKQLFPFQLEASQYQSGLYKHNQEVDPQTGLRYDDPLRGTYVQHEFNVQDQGGETEITEPWAKKLGIAAGTRVPMATAMNWYNNYQERTDRREIAQQSNSIARDGLSLNRDQFGLQEKQFAYSTNPDSIDNRIKTKQLQTMGDDDKIVTWSERNMYPTVPLDRFATFVGKKKSEIIAALNLGQSLNAVDAYNATVPNAGGWNSTAKNLLNAGGQGSMFSRDSMPDFYRDFFSNTAPSSATGNALVSRMFADAGGNSDRTKVGENAIYLAKKISESYGSNNIPDFDKAIESIRDPQVKMSLKNFRDTLWAVVNTKNPNSRLEVEKAVQALKILGLMDGNRNLNSYGQ